MSQCRIYLAYNFVNSANHTDCLGNKNNAHFNVYIVINDKDQNEYVNACIGTKTNKLSIGIRKV